MITLINKSGKEIITPGPVTVGTENEIKEATELQDKVMADLIYCGRKLYPVMMTDKVLLKYYADTFKKMDISTDVDCFRVAHLRMLWGDAEGLMAEMFANALWADNAKTVILACNNMLQGLGHWKEQLKTEEIKSV